MVDELIAQVEQLAQLSTTTVLGTAAPEIGDDVRLFPNKRKGPFDAILETHAMAGLFGTRIGVGVFGSLSGGTRRVALARRDGRIAALGGGGI